MEPPTLTTDIELAELLDGRTPRGRPDLEPLAAVTTAVRARALAEPAPVMSYELRRAIAAGPARRASRSQRRLLDGVAAAVAVFAFGAVSAAGALPGALQNAASNAAGVVGISVPRADDAAERAREAAVAALGEAEDEGTEVKVAAPPDTTPGGAIPADPGTPGDKEPATPATPPEQSSAARPVTAPANEQAGDPSAAGQDNAEAGGENGDAGRESQPAGTGNKVTVDDVLGGTKVKGR